MSEKDQLSTKILTKFDILLPVVLYALAINKRPGIVYCKWFEVQSGIQPVTKTSVN